MQLAKYKLLRGSHVGSDKHRYEANDDENNIILTNLDLVKKFPNKFSKIEDVKSSKQLPTKAEEDSSGSEDTSKLIDEVNEEVDLSEYGDDVTADFEIAMQNDLLVYKKGGWFNIFTSDGEMLNEKGIRKSEVEDTILDLV